jgi:hypothetical protein
MQIVEQVFIVVVDLASLQVTGIRHVLVKNVKQGFIVWEKRYVVLRLIQTP